MPALDLDVALIHMHRGDQGGTGQYLSVDPYFDDLMCMAARRRFMSVEQIVDTDEFLARRPAAVDPHQPAHDRRRRRDAARRALHRVRSRLPARRGVPARVHGVGEVATRRGTRSAPRYIDVTEAEYQRRCGDVTVRRTAHPRRGVRGRDRRVLPRRRRDPRQPDRHAADDRRPARQGDVRARARDDRRRGAARREHPARSASTRPRRSSSGWNPYRTMFDVVWSGRRHIMMGGSQIDQFGNQNFAFIGVARRSRRTQLLGMRGAPGNTINNKTSYWIPDHSHARRSCPRSTW